MVDPIDLCQLSALTRPASDHTHCNGTSSIRIQFRAQPESNVDMYLAIEKLSHYRQLQQQLTYHVYANRTQFCVLFW